MDTRSLRPRGPGQLPGDAAQPKERRHGGRGHEAFGTRGRWSVAASGNGPTASPPAEEERVSPAQTQTPDGRFPAGERTPVRAPHAAGGGGRAERERGVWRPRGGVPSWRGQV